jgi:glycosyltransferase involved in cell wall biosynthesis
VTLRVGVNLLWCVPGEVGGSEEYLARQLAGLAELDGVLGPDGPDDADLELTLFALRHYADAHPELAARFAIVTAPTDGRRRSVRVGFEHTWLVARARERHLHLLHHAGGTMPRAQPARGMLTIHDLQYLVHPEFFSQLKLMWLASAVPSSVQRAAAITVPSQFVKGTVAEAFTYPADRIVVVPHGLDPGFGEPFGEGFGLEPGPDEALLRARYGLPGRIVLYPAITHPHKNHATLLRAVAALGPGYDDVRLVLLGGAGSAAAEVTADIEALGLAAHVVRPGRVPDRDRDGLYRIATVMAFPSLYEGFGAPVLEAMALGCPVLAADATALPEVAGDAAVLVEPTSVDAWQAALAHVLDDGYEQHRLADVGRQRAAQFTAAASARSLLGAYRLATGTP